MSFIRCNYKPTNKLTVYFKTSANDTFHPELRKRNWNQMDFTEVTLHS